MRNPKLKIKSIMESLGGIPNLDNPDLFSIKPDLIIRHKKTKIEYTVEKVDVSNLKSPVLMAFRFNPDGDKKYITISKKEFKDYENV